MTSEFTFEAFKSLKKTSRHGRVSVYRACMADQLTPVQVYQTLSKAYPHAALLESDGDNEQQGRYSFIGFGLLAQLRTQNGCTTLLEGDKIQTVDVNPFDALKTVLNKYRSVCRHPLSGFSGGAMGYVGYDAIRFIEEIPDRHAHSEQLADLLFNFYKHHITFDHKTNRMLLLTLADPKLSAKEAFDQANRTLDQIMKQLSGGSAFSPISTKDHPAANTIDVDVPDEEYVQVVKQAKAYIRAGDLFQVVLSRRFQKTVNVAPFEVYRALRCMNPSPYMFFIRDQERYLMGASPEKLVSVRNGIVEVKPLAGTYRRSGSEESDRKFEERLANDEKETAEHMMLVDLARNDVGAVSKPDSVRVTQLKTVMRCKYVMHLSSTVVGTLQDDKDAVDALRATFPAGTLSGAPKVRAMEIIDELEGSRRGAYGGGICMFDSQGNLESCITIRTIEMNKQVATVRAGAGIVFDSDPKKEAKETRDKAEGALKALSVAQGGML